VIGDLPGIALKGISKDVPWPGARCGWMEYYNRQSDKDFDRFCTAIDNAKMIEVCSTKLPQLAIPKILGNPKFQEGRLKLNQRIGRRSEIITDILSPIPQVTFNPTKGAFYNTIIFRENTLLSRQKLKIANKEIQSLVESWLTPDMPLDKRFVYYLLGAKGVCVVPISSFCSELQGFRVTLLEENEELLVKIFTSIREGIEEFMLS